MPKSKIKGKHLRNIGYRDDEIISLAINIMQRNYKKIDLQKQLEILEAVFNQPENFIDNYILAPVAKGLKPEIIPENETAPYHLREKVPDYKIYGQEHIEQGALHQMMVAMKLPITLAGALMADAHQGYGLPIGGVLATQNVVIPYAVGMDIGCRMCLSIYGLQPEYFERYKTNLKKILVDNTRFGQKDIFNDKKDDPVLDRDEFRRIKFLKSMHSKAIEQIGTSGSGNHFVEFGIIEILEEDPQINVPKGKYIGLLSHSGSRNFGSEIAKHYTKIATDKCNLAKEARYLSWLDLKSEEGYEYWLAMNLAGDYSSSNHHQIHKQIAKALGEKPLNMIENHHNFAWKEILPDGREAIVHRKGATPASKGIIGVIPGSMATPGFIVRGKGSVDSLNSASHGAGRIMSRNMAKNSFTKKQLQEVLFKQSIELIGGNTDESPDAYKDIHQVMEYQKDLVEILGIFKPRIVRMDG